MTSFVSANACLTDNMPHPGLHPSATHCHASELDFMGVCLSHKECLNVQPAMASASRFGTEKNFEVFPPVHRSSEDLCGSHLKLELGPPSSSADGSVDGDGCNEELLSASVGWPPISSLRKLRMASLLESKPFCHHEDILGTSLSMDLQAPVIVWNADIKDQHIARHRDLGTSKKPEMMAKRHQNKSRLVKVSMDGTPIMRKVDLATIQSYPHLSLELHKLFKFYKRNMSCEVGLYSNLKESNEASFVLTYKHKNDGWIPIGHTPWQTFAHLAQQLRIMKKHSLC